MVTATTDATLHNGNLLSTFQSNLGDIIDVHPASSLSYGSEFWPISQLQVLFGDHPSWPKLHTTLLNGSDYNLLQTRHPEDRLADLHHLHAYGNHKSATSPTGITLAPNLMHDDKLRQCAIPILPSQIDDLIGSETCRYRQPIH